MKPRFPTLACVLALFLACLLTTGVPSSGADQRTSRNDPRLRRWLKKFPQADADGDDVLTLVEARAYRNKRQQRRRGGRRVGRPPTHADVRYGPYDRNVLDVWEVESNAPAPALICFHGGGFVGGDKRKYAGTAARYVEEGIAVVAANYRLVRGPQAAPFPAPMLDGARAIQFVRHRAGEWNIDPDRVGLMGGSAGACMSIWIALHDDMADPDAEDPVARQSTRVACVVSHGGQTFLDPDLVRKHIGGSPSMHPSLLPFFGAKSREQLQQPEFQELIRRACAIYKASADDPPILLMYNGPIDDVPLPENAPIGRSIHHPMFGKVLKDRLDPLGVECNLYHAGRRAPENAVMSFLHRHLKPETGRK